MKKTMIVSFSGGRTSAFMSKWLIDNKSNEYDLKFVFANTGLEHEKTLEFVDKCDQEWNLNLVWVEANVNPTKGAPIEFKKVSFKTASRKGEPFNDVCAKHGLPNSSRPFCTQYTKTEVINAYKKSLGLKRNHLTAIGIRADEADRMNFKQLESGSVVYPLIRWKYTTKSDVLMFFKDNDFDLELEEIYGNCVTCFKKSDRHLMTIAKKDPAAFMPFKLMEENHENIKDASGGKCKDDDPYRFFRGNKSVNDFLELGKTEFKEFNPEIRELQLSLDIDPLDKTDDCGGRCEAF